MKIKKRILTPIIISLLCISTIQAQKSHRYRSKKTHEIGIAAGISSFTTDYGSRDDVESDWAGNWGAGFALIHYLSFTDYRYRWNHQTSYWAEHFKIRSEISYHSADLKHYGKWIKIIGGVNGEKLKAMHGRARTLNLGSALEYHFVNINDFGSRRSPKLKWSPYISIGLMVNFYNPSLYTTYGDGNWKEDYSLLFPKWAGPDRARDTKGITLSLTLSYGVRYKIGEYFDLFYEHKNHYFFSNWVDALNARDDHANKAVDWLLFSHIGLVYYLN